MTILKKMKTYKHTNLHIQIHIGKGIFHDVEFYSYLNYNLSISGGHLVIMMLN